MHMLTPEDPEYREVMEILAGYGLAAACPEHGPVRVALVTAEDLYGPAPIPNNAPPGWGGVL